MNKLDNLTLLIQRHIAELKKPGVITVRPGYQTKNGWPTSQPAIVIIISQQAGPAGRLGLPSQIEGVPVDVRQATDLEELAHQQSDTVAKLSEHRVEFRDDAFPNLLADETENPEEPASDVELAATKPKLPYTSPAGVSLSPVTGLFTITCHASPDAGWPTLREFLKLTTKTLTIGLYDFTSKHILDALQGDLLGAKKLTITLDNPARNPTADQTDSETLKSLEEDLGDSFQSAWALVRSNRNAPQWIYPSAYHIKVAVRDSNAMWLSSGNWNNSNQPDFDPIAAPAPGDQTLAKKSDRDWHVIIEHAGLSQTFEAFLAHDFSVANQLEGGEAELQGADLDVVVPDILAVTAPGTFQFHPPLRIANQLMTITPLLTPDVGVYAPAMLTLLNSAQSKLYIQLQYIHPADGVAGLTALIDKVGEKIGAGVDVRIIVSQWQLSNGWLERLQSAGIDLSVVKIQNGVHNKGFVIDSKIVALGSQNWSSDGVLQNRDATVIIENSAAAQYYETIFLHDWNRIARQSTH